ncbi:MAG: hypothetical protein IKV94_02295 [Clostridia bacterium]|nr:hypothetical protein [Clostridia bacterium]
MKIEDKKIKVKILPNEEKIIEVNYKSKIEDLLKDNLCETEFTKIIAARVNNQVKSLQTNIVSDCDVEPITYSDKDGYKIYMRTVKLVLFLAMRELYKDLKVELCNTIDSKSYFICHNFEFTDKMAENLALKMQEIINKNLRITKENMSFEEAYAIYEFQQDEEKLDNMEIKIKANVSMCEVDGIYASMHGIVAPTTGYIKNFGIKKFRKGFVLIYSSIEDEEKIDLDVKENKVFDVFEEFNGYADEMGVQTISDLNQKIIDGSIKNIIQTSEQIQERKLDEITEQIEKRQDVKVVLISGPSCSGKTTFAKRLSNKLRQIGKEPLAISMDNYFKERVDTPKLPNGDYDFETVDALDLELFNNHMQKLLTGETICVPNFNFYTGKKEYLNDFARLNENTIIILEGIHALNPSVTKSISEDLKYKIYIAPMTTLNMDEFSKVSTTDTRVLRRIVRDYRTRGHSVEATLNMWPNITVGENKYIYPFINRADYIFNTSLVYEVAVMSIYAKPVLLQVSTESKNYSEARRLYNFLSNFLTADERMVPQDSLFREFIG